MSRKDRISALPEPLITQILSYLPIKESMRTSVLATSWKNQWLHVPVLELNYKDFSSQDGLIFISFIDRFLAESRLQKLKVKSSSVRIKEFIDRISKVIDRRIQHLKLKGCRYYRMSDGFTYRCNELMPVNLYTCKNLVSLKLWRVALGYGHVKLPCLKLMVLRKILWVCGMTLEKLLSGCPALEELSLRRDLNSDFEGHSHEPMVMRVKSRSLKKLYGSTQKYVLETDAPVLEYLSLRRDHFDTIVVKNVASLFTLDIDIKFVIESGVVDVSKRNEIRDFLVAITSVGHMILSQQTVKVFDRYSKVG